MLVTHRGAFLVIFNLRGSLLMMCSVLGKILLPFYDSLGAYFSSTHEGVFLVILSSLGKTLFLTTLGGVVLVFWTHGRAFDDS